MDVDKIRCNECGRRVKDTPEAKSTHIMRFHPRVPIMRLALLFADPVRLEEIGRSCGDLLRGLL
jgi:hypothetical protein